MTIQLVIALVGLVCGSGVGLAAIGFFFRAGSEKQKLDDRHERLSDLEKQFDELDEMKGDVKGHERRIMQLEDVRERDTKRIADIEIARAGENVELRLRRVEAAFSQQFPRVRAPSRPELPALDFDDEDEVTSGGTRRRRKKED